ncbi:MAG: hypothetical protein NVS4B7_03350 [Ktedonobacteraceae bacterium]
MTMLPSDAQSSRLLPPHPQLQPVTPTPALSIPARLPATSQSTTSPSSVSATELSKEIDHDRAVDFASHSWDLATGGLKTLTAKRELPFLVERRPIENQPEAGAPRSYTFLLIILICLVIMLISGGIVLFVMLQS